MAIKRSGTTQGTPPAQNNRRRSGHSQPTDAPSRKLKGDLDSDGKISPEERLLAVVGYIQTPKGQMMILVAAAVFFAIVNVPSYSKTIQWFLERLNSTWLLPFGWLVAFLAWAVIQVFETLPRTDFWDYDTKVQILKTLNGLYVPIVNRGEGRQSDLLYWQDVTVRDAELRRKLFVAASLFAHVGDFGLLWMDYPLWEGGLWGGFNPANWLLHNILIACFLVFGFEVMVGLARSVRQFLGGYQKSGD